MKVHSETIAHYPGIGAITYKRNLRAKRLTISVRRNKDIRVTIPGVLPFRTAETFVLSKSKWIAEKRNTLNKDDSKLLCSGEFRTREHALLFRTVPTNTIRVEVKKPDIIVYYPETSTISDERVQHAAKVGIEMAYRIEANIFLPQRVKILTSQFNFTINQLRIKKMTSRWGSCSSKNNINLSIFLMKLPDNLIDYIIIHELCHTRHKNHGERFWAELNSKTEGKAKELSRQIRRFSSGI